MKYSIENGKYVLSSDGDTLLSDMPQVAVALAVDTDCVVMHKHGDPTLVSKWGADYKKRLIAAGHQSMADELSVFIGQFPVEELNKMIDNSTYPARFHQKLMDGSLEREQNVVPFEPEEAFTY